MNYKKNIMFSNTSRIFNEGLEFYFEGNNPFIFPDLQKNWDTKVSLQGDKEVLLYLTQEENPTDKPLLELEISRIRQKTQEKLLEALKTSRFQSLQSLSFSKVSMSPQIFNQLQDILRTKPDLKILEISVS